MAQPKSERALRRLVADLARASNDDVEAVLDALSEDHRRTVQGLLDAYLGRRGPSPERQQQPVADEVETDGHSPAIAARLRSRAGGDWRMTDAAYAALRKCARQLPPEPEALRLTATSASRRWSWPPRRRESGLR